MNAPRYAEYRQVALAGLAAYRQRHFAGRDALFEPSTHSPLAFRPEAAHLNLFDPALHYALTRRPRVLRSLSSSRALAISVFGTLARREDLGLLTEVRGDGGQPVVTPAEAQGLALELQHPLSGLGEGREGVVDVWLQGPGLCLAVESRFLERGLGVCPQPGRGRCEGHYRRAGSGWSCRYAQQGVQYWAHLSAALGWSAQEEHSPCPLYATFGPARALAAVAATPLREEAARAVLLVYDARNPAFAPRSRAAQLCGQLQQALRLPFSLRHTTWQAVAGALVRSPWYADLVEYLEAKYGIEAGT